MILNNRIQGFMAAKIHYFDFPSLSFLLCRRGRDCVKASATEKRVHEGLPFGAGLGARSPAPGLEDGASPQCNGQRSHTKTAKRPRARRPACDNRIGHSWLFLAGCNYSWGKEEFMNVSLTPELEKFVAQKVESGLYRSASEVIREGLRLLDG